MLGARIASFRFSLLKTKRAAGATRAINPTRIVLQGGISGARMAINRGCQTFVKYPPEGELREWMLEGGEGESEDIRKRSGN